MWWSQGSSRVNKHYNFANNSTDLSSVYKQVHTQLFFEHVTQHSSLMHCFRRDVPASVGLPHCNWSQRQPRVCVFQSKQLYASLMQYSTHRAYPYLFKSPLWERSRKSESTERHRKNFDVSWAHPALLRHLQHAPNERVESSWRARGEVLQNSPKFWAPPSTHYTRHCALPTSCLYRMIRWSLNEMKKYIWRIMCLGDKLKTNK